MTDPYQQGNPAPGAQPPPDPNYPAAPVPGQQPSPQPQSAQQAPHRPKEPKHPFSAGQILGGILLILLIIFIAENSTNVPIRIIAGPIVHPPLWVAIVIAAVLGALIAALLRYRRRVGARRKALVREHKAENRQ